MRLLAIAAICLFIPVLSFANPARQFAEEFDKLDAAIFSKSQELRGAAKEHPDMVAKHAVHQSIVNHYLEQTRLMNRRLIDLFLLLSVMNNKQDRDAVINTILAVHDEDYKIYTKNAVIGFEVVSKKATWTILKKISDDMQFNIARQKEYLDFFCNQFE